MMESNFQDLIDFEVSAISFVRDYVEIHFDGPVVRLFDGPNIISKSDCIRFPSHGSRDSLCSLIGKRVLKIELSESSLNLYFECDFRISSQRNSEIPEFAHLWNKGCRLLVLS